MALALLFVLGLAEDLRLVPGGRIADESFLAISGLTDADAAAERSAHAEEADLEADSTPSPKPSEAAPQESTAPDGGPSANPAGSSDPSAAPNPDEGAAPAEPSVEPSTEPSIGPSTEPSLDPSIEPAASNDPDEENPEAPPSLRGADATQFSCGYAHIASGSTVCVSAASGATELATLSAGVVYVAETDADGGPAKICFAHEGLAYAAWTDADNLTPLTADELDALRIPSDAPTYGGKPLPEPGARFLLQLSIESCPELTIGDSFALVAAYSDGKDYSIQWSSSDPSVATVDGGTLTAVSPGEAIITASGVCAPASIRIAVSEPASISLSAGSISIGLGETVTDALCCTVTPAALRDSLSWSSSNTRYVKVDKATGAITGLRTGSATVTVTAPGGLRASCKVTVRSAPRSVKLSAGTSVLGVGDSTSLTASFNSGAYSHGMLYAISDESIVRLEDGRLHAAAPGEATITVKTFNGKTASMKITVLPEPESVSFSAEAPILGVGQRYQLSAAVNPESVSAIAYSGDKPEVAEVSPDGSITAIAVGSVNVTATAYNGVSSTQTITVVPAPTEMTLENGAIYIGLGEVLGDALQIRFNEGSASSVRFKSSNTRYVKVNADGTLTGLRVGSATVTVTSHNGLTASCRVVVQQAPSKVALRLPMSAFSVGQTQRAEVSVTGRGHWILTSSDPTVVAVEDGSVLRALQEGDVTITARTYNGKTASAKLHVLPAPEEVYPVVESASVAEGLQIQVEFYVNEGSCATFSYAVADPSLARVDESGCVTGLQSGHTQLTATTHNGLTASMELEILPGPDEILFDDEALTIGLGELRSFGFKALPEDAVGVYSYASSDPKIVRVSEDGQLAGISIGTAIITVTAQNGTSAELNVTVVPYSQVSDAINMAHRGASGYRPDNSIAAFEYAAELGADMVELDVRKTKDGVIVVIHDGTISYNGKKYDVASLTMKQLRIANPNICTLDEALTCIAATDMEVMIEFKVSGIEQDVLDLVGANGMEGRAKYGSFTLSVINRVKALQPSAETIYIISNADTLKKVVNNPQSYSASIISVSTAILKANDIYRLHLGGKQVVAWTINTRSEIQRFIEMGVDGITTNFPDYM